MFQASGASMDAEAIVEEIARLKNRPEFKRFITFAAPADQLGGDQNTIRQSPITSRETVRKNVPTGGTQGSRSAIMQQTLMGGKPQVNGQQKASMMQRPA
jgi:tRNA A37 threonylcarbamoyladenosine synthetase subunit TsaC/SUA5/YrdC